MREVIFLLALLYFFSFLYNKHAAAATAKSLQSCPTLCDPIDGSPPGSPSLGFSRQEHWRGRLFLLQCVKVKSESEVTQSCLTLSDSMDYSLPGCSIHGVFPGKSTGVGCHLEPPKIKSVTVSTVSPSI